MDIALWETKQLDESIVISLRGFAPACHSTRIAANRIHLVYLKANALIWAKSDGVSVL